MRFWRHIVQTSLLMMLSFHLAASVNTQVSTTLSKSEIVIYDTRLRSQISSEEFVDRLQHAHRILVGEQHDSPTHHLLESAIVQVLPEGFSLLLEMLDHTVSVKPRSARSSQDEEQIKADLAWNERRWPWADYWPVIKAAYSKEITISGANLTQDERMSAYTNGSPLENQALTDELEERLSPIIQNAHCNLLPEQQISPMTHIQIAKDQRMSQAVEARARAVLIAGSYHVDKRLGIPRHFTDDTKVLTIIMNASSDTERAALIENDAFLQSADLILFTPREPAVDHCGELKRKIHAQ